MYSAYSQWDKEKDCLTINTLDASGTHSFPAPIRPFFKCLTNEATTVRDIGRNINDELAVYSSDFINVEKKPCSIVQTTKPMDVGQIREVCFDKGLGHKHILEADIPFIRNWMLEKDIRCATNYTKLFWDIEVWDKDGKPTPKNPIFPITSIACADQDDNRYFFSDRHSTLEEAQANEHGILSRFIDLLNNKHYGLITGYYSGGGNAGKETTDATFDYPYTMSRLKINKIYFKPQLFRWMDLVIPFVYTRQHKPKSTSLDAVASSLFGEHKKRSPNKKYIADYTLEELEEYNLQDALLTKGIDETALEGNGSLTDLMIQIAYETHIFPDEVLYTPNIHIQPPNPSRAIDALLIEEARKVNYALPSKPSNKERVVHKGYSGASIQQTIPGVYDDVLSVDVESLYPFCIMYDKISPDPDGLILPNVERRYLDKKRNARTPTHRQAYKIILVASYGLMGSTYSRVYNTQDAEAVTKRGKEVITKAKEIIKNKGFDVVYSHTDSCLILLPADPRETGLDIVKVARSISDEVTKQLREIYQSHDFEFNMPPAEFYSEVALLRTSGDRGAKNRLYGHVTWNAKKGDCDYYKAVGIEKVRSDQFSLLERTQETILKLHLKRKDDEAKQYIITVKDMLFEGLIPTSDLVLSKGFGQDCYEHNWEKGQAVGDKFAWICSKCKKRKISKELPKNSIPAHVRVRNELINAGLWSGQDNKVHYVWTIDGPKPYLNKELENVDYNKYFTLLANMARRADVEVDIVKTTKPKAEKQSKKKQNDRGLDRFLFSS